MYHKVREQNGLGRCTKHMYIIMAPLRRMGVQIIFWGSKSVYNTENFGHI